MKVRIAIVAFSVFLFSLPLISVADTIYFNDGQTREGIIKSENDDSVEIDIGFGTVTFSKKNIAKTERSTPEETDAISQKWQTRQAQIRNNKDTFERERRKRFDEYDAWTKNSSKNNSDGDVKPGEAALLGDPTGNNFFVKATINDKIDTTLILDTGADVVVVSKKIGEALGVDLTDANQVTEFRLAGDRRVKARMVILNKIKINDVEAKNVLAGIILEENSGLMLRDGLLGMTFLKRFNFKIDRKNMKLVLDKL
jgi:clan AA aspartic protease (TIGR02281 family)